MPPRATLPASWKTWVPRDRPTPRSAYACAAVGEDHRHRAEGQHVVDGGRLAEEALERGDRRLGAHLAAPALEALEHRGLLAADVGAGAHAHVEVEVVPAAEDVAAEEAVGVGGLDGAAQRGDRVRVLGADVDVALARADGVRRDGHPLDQRERVALDDHPVGEGAGVALVEVAGDELRVAPAASSTVFHLMPAGKPAPPRPRSPESVTSCDDLGGGHRQGPPQPGPAAVRLEARDVLAGR